MKSKENLTDQNKAAKKSFLIKKNGSNQSSVHNKTHAHNDVPPSQIEFVIMFYKLLQCSTQSQFTTSCDLPCNSDFWRFDWGLPLTWKDYPFVI